MVEAAHVVEKFDCRSRGDEFKRSGSIPSRRSELVTKRQLDEVTADRYARLLASAFPPK